MDVKRPVYARRSRTGRGEPARDARMAGSQLEILSARFGAARDIGRSLCCGVFRAPGHAGPAKHRHVRGWETRGHELGQLSRYATDLDERCILLLPAHDYAG